MHNGGFALLFAILRIFTNCKLEGPCRYVETYENDRISSVILETLSSFSISDIVWFLVLLLSLLYLCMYYLTTTIVPYGGD